MPPMVQLLPHVPDLGQEKRHGGPYAASARARVEPQDPPRLPAPRGPRVGPRGGRAGHERALSVVRGVSGRAAHTHRTGRRARRACPTSPPWSHKPMGGARRARRRRGWVARRARSGACKCSKSRRGKFLGTPFAHRRGGRVKLVALAARSRLSCPAGTAQGAHVPDLAPAPLAVRRTMRRGTVGNGREMGLGQDADLVYD